MAKQKETTEENPNQKLVDFFQQFRETAYNSLPEMKIALLREGAIFQKANEFAAGYDIKAFNMTIEDGYIKFMLGIKSEMPKGWYAEVVHKSSNSKFDTILANTKGTIDADFRGEWQARLKLVRQPNVHQNLHKEVIANYEVDHDLDPFKIWAEGEIALQVIFHKEPEHRVTLIPFGEEANFSDSVRGEGGFGSTGNGLAPEGYAPRINPSTFIVPLSDLSKDDVSDLIK